jgi:hypothetical protein
VVNTFLLGPMLLSFEAGFRGGVAPHSAYRQRRRYLKQRGERSLLCEWDTYLR